MAACLKCYEKAEEKLDELVKEFRDEKAKELIQEANETCEHPKTDE